jgi:hypothetical protein
LRFKFENCSLPNLLSILYPASRGCSSPSLSSGQLSSRQISSQERRGKELHAGYKSSPNSNFFSGRIIKEDYIYA